MARAKIAEAAVLCGVPEQYDPLYETFSADEDATASFGPFAFACTPPITCVLGAVAFAQGHSETAVRHCERALALSDRMAATAHRAWVHLTWGEGLRGRPDAHEHLERARDAGDRLQMPEILVRVGAALELDTTGPPRSVPAATTPPFALRRDGAEWSISHGGETFRLKDVRGLGMLANLVQSPGREIHSLDLASNPGAETSAVIDVGDAGEIIDARAREAYKRRISDLREAVDEAEHFADTVRAARLRYELDALTDQIAGAVGLGGRARRSGSAAERARIVVQRRVREAIQKITDVDANLGRHLDWTVRTGTFCVYEPGGRRSKR
jgi:hypothetical protein